jgi:hypothetical protein
MQLQPIAKVLAPLFAKPVAQLANHLTELHRWLRTELPRFKL